MRNDSLLTPSMDSSDPENEECLVINTQQRILSISLFLRPVLSEHTDSVREFEQGNEEAYFLHLIVLVQVTFQQGCKQPPSTKQYEQNMTQILCNVRECVMLILILELADLTLNP